MNSIGIKAPREIVRKHFLDPDIILRLNPAWYIRKTEAVDNGVYAVTLYDDRTDETSQVHVKVEEFEKSISYTMNAETIEFLMNESTNAGTELSIHGGFFREADLPYWLKGLKNYIQLAAKQSRFIKWLLDRFWLRMTPSQRRIAIIIILAEGLGLAALIAVIVALKFLK